jgi:hypothetical protein
MLCKLWTVGEQGDRERVLNRGGNFWLNHYIHISVIPRWDPTELSIDAENNEVQESKTGAV